MRADLPDEQDALLPLHRIEELDKGFLILAVDEFLHRRNLFFVVHRVFPPLKLDIF